MEFSNDGWSGVDDPQGRDSLGPRFPLQADARLKAGERFAPEGPAGRWSDRDKAEQARVASVDRSLERPGRIEGRRPALGERQE